MVFHSPSRMSSQRRRAALIEALESRQLLSGTADFYRAVNFNGPAATLDGNAWEGGSAPNLQLAYNYSFTNNTTSLDPATDAVRTQMIRSSIFGLQSSAVSMLNVPAGTYQVYLYNWEDNSPVTFSVQLEGQLVLSNFSSGSAGTWNRLGPWEVDVTDGSLDLIITGRDVNLSGLEVFRLGQTPISPPAAPLNLQATATAPTQVQLNWQDASNNETDFVIEWRIGTGSWAGLATVGVNATSYLDTTAQANTAYTYRVAARNSAGTSTFAQSAEVRTPDVPPPSTEAGFYRAFNLNGQALTIDGNAWEAGSASDLRLTTSSSFTNNSVTLSPPTDAARSQMIRSSIFGYQSSAISLLSVPAGTYQVYLYNWEDNNPVTFSVRLEGQVVLSNFSSGGAGTWNRLGPWEASVTDGSLDLVITGRDVNLSGLEVFRVGQTPATAPAAPLSLQAFAASPTQVQLSWQDASSNETDFVIERRIGTGAWSPLATVGANVTNYTDNTAQANTAYTYRVAARNSVGTSTFAQSAEVRTPVTPPPTSGPLKELRVSSNGRYLVDSDGKGFFWLADTAWELFHRLTRQEADLYLQTRAAQGYNVIQAVGLAELGNTNSPNAYGDSPLVDADPARLAVTPGSDPNDPQQYDYWDHVRYIVAKANSLGMYVAMLPTWASWVNAGIITSGNAEAYGYAVARQLSDLSVIWVMGGDRQGWGKEDVYRAMARGVTIGDVGSEDYSRTLMTYHPPEGDSSSLYFHNEAWLDFNMNQSGHGSRDNANYRMIERDYAKTPAKPTLDAEPRYEDAVVGWNLSNGRFNAFDVRQAEWWAVLAGALGHTYGHLSIWQMYAPGRNSEAWAQTYWYDALQAEGATDMVHLRTLLESHNFAGLTPDQSMVVDAYTGADYVAAARGTNYAIFYVPTGRAIDVRLGKIAGATVRASWYDPRTGQSQNIGTYTNSGTTRFTPPSSGRGNDWVLVLDA